MKKLATIIFAIATFAMTYSPRKKLAMIFLATTKTRLEFSRHDKNWSRIHFTMVFEPITSTTPKITANQTKEGSYCSLCVFNIFKVFSKLFVTKFSKIMWQLVAAERGGRKLLHGGYVYTFHANLKRGRASSWRCVERGRCGATIRVTGEREELVREGSGENDSIIRVGEHTHAPNWGKTKGLELLQEARNEAIAHPNTLPAEIAQKVKAKADAETAPVLPKTASILRCISRSQGAVQEKAPSTLEEIIAIPPRLSSVNGEDFVLKRSARLLVLATRDGLTTLSRSRTWLSDGTFKAAPRGVRQLYVLHALLPTHRQTVPCVFSLMIDKSVQSYVELFGTVVESCDTLGKGSFRPPDMVLIDFEASVHQAVGLVIPKSNVSFCLFHFAKILWRRLQVAGLQEEYAQRENMILRKHFHMLVGLAFIPAYDVSAVFDDLVEHIDTRLEPLCDHLHRYYVHGTRVGKRSRGPQFPPVSWSCFERVYLGLPRTTNALEGWHHKLNTLLRRAHANMWTLLEQLVLLEGEARYDRCRFEAGRSPPVQRKEYRTLDARISAIVSRYATYKDEERQLEYLEACGACFAGNIPKSSPQVSDSEDDDSPPQTQGPAKKARMAGATETQSFKSHMMHTLNTQEWLDDTIINAVMVLIKKAYPAVVGLNDTVVVAAGQVTHTADAVQVHHDSIRQHWYASRRLVGTVHVADSMTSDSLSHYEQLRNYYGLDSDTQVHILPVQQQDNTFDCGPFALAFAAVFATQGDPSREVFNAKLLRQHLQKVLQDQEFRPFPSQIKQGRKKLAKVLVM